MPQIHVLIHYFKGVVFDDDGILVGILVGLMIFVFWKVIFKSTIRKISLSFYIIIASSFVSLLNRTISSAKRRWLNRFPSILMPFRSHQTFFFPFPQYHSINALIRGFVGASPPPISFIVFPISFYSIPPSPGAPLTPFSALLGYQIRSIRFLFVHRGRSLRPPKNHIAAFPVKSSVFYEYFIDTLETANYFE